jgi:hypothetical protein
MDSQTIRDRVISVLEHVQKSGNYPAPRLTGSTCPLKDLDGFDSQMGVTATGLLAVALGTPIAADRNLFRAKGATRALTIDEVVVEVSLDLVAGLGADGPAAIPGPATPSASVTP